MLLSALQCINVNSCVILLTLNASIHARARACTHRGAVAQCLERATDNRVVAGSNPAEAVWKLWQFPLPHFASVFRKRH